MAVTTPGSPSPTRDSPSSPSPRRSTVARAAEAAMPGFVRRLTSTPLARALDAEIAGRRTRKHPVVPWKAFRPADWPDGALEAAYDAMRMLAAGEYLAVEGFSRMAASFAYHELPFDLVAACAAVPTDEIRHAELAVRAASM